VCSCQPSALLPCQSCVAGDRSQLLTRGRHAVGTGARLAHGLAAEVLDLLGGRVAGVWCG
jgi:hypothetical protein